MLKLKSQLRTLPDSVLKTMQPLCNEYVLAGVIINAAPDPHYQNYVKKLHDEIINKNFKLVVIKEVKVFLNVCEATLFHSFAISRTRMEGLWTSGRLEHRW